MFEFVRNNKRVLQFVLLLLIIPSFVLVGVESYQNRGDSGAGVASVDGRNITQQEWDDAQRRQIDQARQQMGPQFDQKLFDTPEAKREVLDNLVAERAVNAEIARNHLTVSDHSVFKAINALEQFKKPDGSFDMDAYKAAVAAQGMTPEMFDARTPRHGDPAAGRFDPGNRLCAALGRQPYFGHQRPGTRSPGTGVPDR
jgi:peptidyl-prolyl cis-trans isomerase D